jgi:membrane protein
VDSVGAAWSTSNDPEPRGATVNETKPAPTSLPLLERARLFFTEDIWRPNLDAQPLPVRLAAGLVRVLVLATSGIIRNRSTFAAAGLAYITILSLVPFLAFAFSVAKGMGAYARLHDEVIIPFLDRNLGVVTETTPQSIRSLRDTIDGILELVSNTQVSSLGTFGLIIVVLAVLRALSSVEHSFNEIFGVPRPRGIVRRIADYLSLTIATPLLMVLAVTVNSGLIGLFENTPVLGWIMQNLNTITPLVSVWVGFTLLYLILPNTSVPLLPAMAGGLVGSGLWHIAQYGHKAFQIGIANYNAIYSSFAAVPIFLAWIYFSWLTVMFAAEFTYALTHAKHYRQILLHDLDSTRSREILALRAVAHIVRQWNDGKPPTTRELADHLEVPSGPLAKVLAPLVRAQILSEGGDPMRPAWLPSRSPESARVSDVLEVLRGDGPEVDLDHKLDHEVTELYEEMRKSEQADPRNVTLAQLAELGG